MRHHSISLTVFIMTVAVLGLLTACKRGGNTGAAVNDRPGTETDVGGQVEAETGMDGRYFKSGDFTYQLRIRPGDAEYPDSPVLEFNRRDPEWSNSFSVIHSFRLENRAADGTFTLNDMAYGQEGTAFTVDWKWNGPVVLHGNTDEAGTYYPYNTNLKMPELFERPLNETDLIGLTREEIKIMRNQFYAVYGRSFTTPEMKTYFEGQPWYEPHVDADRFSEGVFGGLEKRNIAFLKQAEEVYDEAQVKEARAVYDALPAAPYLDRLPERGEIHVEMYSDLEHTADRGLYYEAQGSISVPMRITREEYLALEDGKTVELVSDELTGETSVLKKAADNGYGDYVLMDPDHPDEDVASYVYLTYEPFSRTFSMWENSADTIFKRVYEGNLYVLKGACEEWYNYFNMQERPEGAGAFRVMDFNETDPYGPSPYQGNILVTDAKGYIKALYFMGD